MKLNPIYARDTSAWKLAGAETFRASSAKLFGRWGGNRQNVEKSLRRLYVPDRGKIFCQCDQSGAEALIVAYLTTHGNFRDLFLNKIKSHVFVALHVFKKQFEKKLEFSLDTHCISPVKELTSSHRWQDVDKIIKESDKWPASERYYYLAKKICHACVDSQTEVLTHQGWCSVEEASKDNREIMIYDPRTNQSFFSQPTNWIVTDYSGDMLLFAGKAFQQLVTPNHKMIYWSNSTYHTALADVAFTRPSSDYRTSSYYEGSVKLSSTDIALIAAIQADGHINKNTDVEFHLKKDRKIDRLIELLKAGGYHYYYYDNPDFTVKIVFRKPYHLLKWFGPNKLWGPWLLTWSGEALDTLLKEIPFWDGHRSRDIRNATYFFSVHKQNIEWIHTILHLRGKQGLIREKSGHYNLSFNSRQFSTPLWREKINYAGQVFCPTVETGFFLVRRNGKISVTGNSNYGIKANTFATAILKDSRGQVNLSVKQAQEYLDAYHKLFPEIRLWHREVDLTLRVHHRLHNLFRYPRYFFTPVDENNLKEALAFIPQSTVGCITHIALTKLQNYIEENHLDWDILNNCHDSYLVQCPVDEAAECCKQMKFFMEQKLTNFRQEEFYMRSEALVGRNWGDMKELK